MTDYIMMDLASKTEQLTRAVEDMKDILSRMLEGQDQMNEMIEDIRRRVTDYEEDKEEL